MKFLLLFLVIIQSNFIIFIHKYIYERKSLIKYKKENVYQQPDKPVTVQFW